MKGIVLAGGSGSRLYPITRAVNKQLLPVYDKPMIYYPLSVLMSAGIRDVLIVTTPNDLPSYQSLFGNGSRIGMRCDYVAQSSPRGLADAFLIGRDFVAGDAVTLVLGDNIFFGDALPDLLMQATAEASGATIFAYEVPNPERYGVVTFDAWWRPVSLEEKPSSPQSGWAVTGLYVYNNSVLDIAASLRPSARGELEITDINRAYLQRGELRAHRLGPDFTWLDTGTCDSLLAAGEFVRTVQRRQARPIACIEEIAFRQGWIDLAQIERLADEIRGTQYDDYLRTLLNGARTHG